MSQPEMPTKEIVLNMLHNVIDPEVGVNIVDLGLIYGVEISGNKLRVDLHYSVLASHLGGHRLLLGFFLFLVFALLSFSHDRSPW